jgi:hypothetical protein
MFVCVYIYKHLGIGRRHVCICMHVYICTYMCTHAHRHIYIYLYIYMYILEQHEPDGIHIHVYINTYSQHKPRMPGISSSLQASMLNYSLDLAENRTQVIEVNNGTFT